jgi:hypothetical protein
VFGQLSDILRQRRWHDALYFTEVWYHTLAKEITIDWQTGNVTGTNFMDLPFTLTPVHPNDLLTTAFRLSIDGGEPHIVPRWSNRPFM